MIDDRIRGRILSILIMVLCTNSIFGQSKDALSLSLEEIKDMPQKIIKAYILVCNGMLLKTKLTLGIKMH